MSLSESRANKSSLLGLRERTSDWSNSLSRYKWVKYEFCSRAHTIIFSLRYKILYYRLLVQTVVHTFCLIDISMILELCGFCGYFKNCHLFISLTFCNSIFIGVFFETHFPKHCINLFNNFYVNVVLVHFAGTSI